MNSADGMVIGLNDPVLRILRKDIAGQFQKFLPSIFVTVLLLGDVLMTHKE